MEARNHPEPVDLMDAVHGLTNRLKQEINSVEDILDEVYSMLDKMRHFMNILGVQAVCHDGVTLRRNISDIVVIGATLDDISKLIQLYKILDTASLLKLQIQRAEELLYRSHPIGLGSRRDTILDLVRETRKVLDGVMEHIRCQGPDRDSGKAEGGDAV